MSEYLGRPSVEGLDVGQHFHVASSESNLIMICLTSEVQALRHAVRFNLVKVMFSSSRLRKHSQIPDQWP